MPKITLKTGKRKTRVSRAIIRHAVKKAYSGLSANCRTTGRGVIAQRVLPLGNGWVVKPDHLKKFITVTTTQRQAISIATELAKNDHALLIVHNKNGTNKQQKSFAKVAARRAR
jgi:hypothetical protein